MPRTREQLIQYVPKGTLKYRSGVVIQDNPFIMKSAVCVDSTGIDTDHPMTITKYDKSGIAPLNGVRYVLDTYSEYKSYQPVGAAFVPSHLVLSPPSATSAATTTLARTNPGRAEVSIPVFVRELKDLPSMLKNIGDLLKKSKKKKPLVKLASGEYLSWTFGWLPLISDLKKMLNFQVLVSKRVKELERLHSKGGLKRRFTTFTDSATDDVTVIWNGASDVLRVRKHIKTDVRQWATVRWLPTSIPSAKSSDLGQQARNAVFGLSGGIQAEDVWEIIPWSWLIDWFSNVGTFLQAHNNRVPSSASVVNVMTETRTSISLQRVDSYSTIKGGDGTVTLVTKDRKLSSGGLSIGEGFLSPHQLSILGALAINRLSSRF